MEESIDLSRGVIWLERTKSGRRREVPMRQAVRDLPAAMPEPRTGRLWPDGSHKVIESNARVVTTCIAGVAQRQSN